MTTEIENEQQQSAAQTDDAQNGTACSEPSIWY